MFDDGNALDSPLAEPDYVETDVASCKAKIPSESVQTGLTDRSMTAASPDRSLVWRAAVQDDRSRIVYVDLAQDDGSFKRVHEYTVAVSGK